ncbi:MAG: UMP kinase [Thermoplasmata archaeon]|nr:UMP kinase [Thermoplasmata archaeon]
MGATDQPGPRPVVLSVGGSVILSADSASDAPYLTELADVLREFGRTTPLAVTTGGGRIAREYIRLGRLLGLTEVELDEVGIAVTRIHARLLAARIGPPTPLTPAVTTEQAAHELHRASPVVLGGTEPGHTTDGVAAMLAVRLRAARLVNATSVAGLYDHDPRTHPDAQRRERLGWEEFRAIVHESAGEHAGQEFVFDRFGADQLRRAGIPLAIVDGRDLPNLRKALAGKPFLGTSVE